MSWALIPNPGYSGPPRPLVPTCHDGSPFLTIECGCGRPMHLHESQISRLPADAELAARCPICSGINVLPVVMLADAFAGMRADGWIE